MLIGDLLGRPVCDGDREIGSVVDVRFALGADGSATVIGLIAGDRRSLGVRRLLARGPLPGTFVPWSAVAEIGPPVRLRAGTELGPLTVP